MESVTRFDLDGLRDIVGVGNVLTGDEAEPMMLDWREVHHGSAIAAVRPSTTAEVAAVVEWCGGNDTVIVAQGGNTGLSGGGIPMGQRPAILLSTRRMNRIEAVDTAGWTMTVQAGVTIEAMQQAATAESRLFGPDWGARGTATIGGALATDAGGNNVVRYGTTRDHVLGLEVVMADGTIWDGLRQLRKDSSGYDLKHLFIGSEGTLGVITRAVVKLLPATPHEQSALAALRDLDDLMAFFAMANDVAAESVVAFELMPEIGVSRVNEMLELPHPMEARADFYVLVKLASTSPVTDLMTELMARAVDVGLITDAVVASTAEQEERLWTIRDELPPMGLYPEQHRAGLKMDTAVPIARMGEYHNAVRAIAEELVPGALVYGFGHVGDGNLHMNVLPFGDDQIEAFGAAKPELMRRIDEITFELGGTLSAEHGVGRELRDRVVAQKPEVEWEMMRAVKAALDPDDRFNPGVLLPDPYLNGGTLRPAQLLASFLRYSIKSSG